MEFKGTIGIFSDGTTGWKVKTNEQHWNNKDIQSHEIIWSDDEECVVDHVYDLADAKLIAAAPDLLRALILMQVNGFQTPSNKDMLKVDEAIEKALK